MAVPEEIRMVERPVNTIVQDSGRDTKYRYSVRERGEIVYESGSNPRPKNGRVVGHIIDGRFVPKAEETSTARRNWATARPPSPTASPPTSTHRDNA